MEVRTARTCEQLPELHLQTLPDFVFCLSALNARTGVNLATPKAFSPRLPG